MYENLEKVQRIVNGGELIFSPSEEDMNGYFLKRGTVALVDNEEDVKQAERRAVVTLSGPVIINMPSILKDLPTTFWAVAVSTSMVYIFPRDTFMERYNSEDPFLSAVNDFTLARIEKSKPTLGLADIVPE
tara:strand:- start:83 stop:475 length:393 start_codon:yes stop_codon:yes gene_type:complete